MGERDIDEMSYPDVKNWTGWSNFFDHRSCFGCYELIGQLDILERSGIPKEWLNPEGVAFHPGA